MKRLFPLATVALTLLVSPALSHAEVTTQNTHSDKARKVEIVSGGATQTDLHLSWLREFGNFERDHSAISRDFSRDPLLVSSNRFRNQHPEWAAFLRAHPAIQADIKANPGNYVVIRPRLAYVPKHERQSKHAEPNGKQAKA